MSSKEKKVKKKKTVRKADIILIVGLIIIALPFCVLGWFLISAQLASGKPNLGDRYANDLDPSITSSEQKDIEKDVKNIDGVEDVNVELTTATLRVYVDISDSAVETDAVSIANQTYDKVVNVLSPSIYFSQHDNMKMYDLEIHVYNLDKDRENENFVYVIKLKNSNMDESTIQTVSKAKDEALAQQLRDDVEAKNNPQQDDEGDITVGSGETEDTPSETNDDSQEEE
ncbi:MAG: hypothetical protein PUF67_03695 [Firmicutes bacterium]|nr:hypothetical protein [Erysipelotrichaceae bacterium]MDD6525321.1 hypothetical protein [Bacillota bacterium]MDD7227848.1 hypothetical protein [Bacillota bacterium]MDY4972511.1 hypothetical protein [Erysipelotrichaceae bacterium]MDY5997675.1 hypothetical protein [Erysipelotrichaceae bacterium]